MTKPKANPSKKSKSSPRRAIRDEVTKNPPVAFRDRADITGTRRTADGYLIADARVARAGVQEYEGHELGRPDLDMVRVWRPEGEVFKSASLKSFAHKPVTVGHPDEAVSVENWDELAVGTVGEDVVRDGGYVRVPLLIMDKSAIKVLAKGQREISMGYDAKLEWSDGVTDAGERYDAIQRNIRINHAAIVARGRAGPACRVGDDAHPIKTPAKGKPKMKTITHDGKEIEVTEDVHAVITRLQTREAEAAKDIKTMADSITASAASLKAEKDALAGQIAAKDAEIADLKAKVPTHDQIAKLAADRMALEASARKIVADIETAGKSDADLRIAVVAKKLGDEAVANRSAEYLSAVFDTLSSAIVLTTADPVRDAIKAGAGGTGDKATGARAKYLADQARAWQ